MSVIGVAHERQDSPSATLELNKMSFVRKFLVKTSSKNDGPVTVCSAVGIPRPFQIYTTPNEYQKYARCRSVDCERVEPASLFWVVTAHYSTPEVSESSGGASNATEKDGQNDNPLLVIPEIETHQERFEQAVYSIYSPTATTVVLTCTTTINSNVITVNSPGDASTVFDGMSVFGATIAANTIVASVDAAAATIYTNLDATATNAAVALTFSTTQTVRPVQATTGEIFDPCPTKDASRLILSVVRNEDISSPHPLTSLLFADTINSDVFFGCGKGQVKCMGVSAAKQTKTLSNGGIFSYLKCTYTFQMRPTWAIQILNAGNWYWADITKTKKKKFMSSEGHPIQGLLDKNGLKLPDGGTPLFVTFQAYQAQKFSVLNLPQSFIQAS